MKSHCFGRRKGIYLSRHPPEVVFKKCKFPYLKLRISTQQHIKSLQVILIREDLNYAIHQVELGQLIFAVHDLSNIIEENEPFLRLEIDTCL
jgi:hypothetical protein